MTRLSSQGDRCPYSYLQIQHETSIIPMPDLSKPIGQEKTASFSSFPCCVFSTVRRMTGIWMETNGTTAIAR